MTSLRNDKQITICYTVVWNFILFADDQFLRAVILSQTCTVSH